MAWLSVAGDLGVVIFVNAANPFYLAIINALGGARNDIIIIIVVVIIVVIVVIIVVVCALGYGRSELSTRRAVRSCVSAGHARRARQNKQIRLTRARRGGLFNDGDNTDLSNPRGYRITYGPRDCGGTRSKIATTRFTRDVVNGGDTTTTCVRVPGRIIHGMEGSVVSAARASLSWHSVILLIFFFGKPQSTW